jgi:hypothetical protein
LPEVAPVAKKPVVSPAIRVCSSGPSPRLPAWDQIIGAVPAAVSRQQLTGRGSLSGESNEYVDEVGPHLDALPGQ